MSNTTYKPGVHILLDFFGAVQLSNKKIIEQAMRAAAAACHATLLDVHLHAFGQDSGITGVALLAESHISIHTWPEIQYAALDVFMCGDCDARLAIAPLQAAFQPVRVEVKEVERGKSIDEKLILRTFA